MIRDESYEKNQRCAIGLMKQEYPEFMRGCEVFKKNRGPLNYEIITLTMHQRDSRPNPARHCSP